MSDAISSFQNKYTQSFPTGVPSKAAQGFIATAAVSLLVGTGTNAALVGGTLAAIATTIESITRPIILNFFSGFPCIGRAVQIVIPKTIAYSLASSIAPQWCANYKITFSMLSLIAWFSLNNSTFERNTAMAEVLVVLNR